MEEVKIFDQIRCYKVNTVVVGTGAAGYNAADELWASGQKDIVVVTEHINSGTSRNTGSDKQTYYKLTLAGKESDSVEEMANTLFAGGCVDGDLALCEAALSAQCYYKLSSLGVPFPRNRWGESIGYKTDHDPRCRATSAGPYTSKYMTECLERAVCDKGIQIMNKLQVIKILSDKKKVYGLLCLDLNNQEEKEKRYVVFFCKNIVFATGGPAGMYADSVFPLGHYGASGTAFMAGVKGKNLTEWQCGVSSLKPRWNVSGTYMQVLPRFFSVDENGEEYEFLEEYFSDRYEMLSKIFLKGYQWPFDVRKAMTGSSVIDILVYREKCKGRRLFLDYRKNPGDEEIDFVKLEKEAYEYLERAGGCFGTPIERLKHMNIPAVEFYKNRGVNLEIEPLEIALCVQHNNGGLGIDAWWQTNVEGFYAVGEVSASHGVYRPGGSALNAGQVGSVRAAKYISVHGAGMPEEELFLRLAEAELQEAQKLAAYAEMTNAEAREDVNMLWEKATRRMTECGSAIRNESQIKKVLSEIKNELQNYENIVKVEKGKELWKVFRLKDILVSQFVYLSAMEDYISRGGKSRGSALYSDANGEKPADWLSDEYRFCLEDEAQEKQIQEVVYKDGEVMFEWRKARPIPTEDDFFENVWRSYRENQNVY